MNNGVANAVVHGGRGGTRAWLTPLFAALGIGLLGGLGRRGEGEGREGEGGGEGVEWDTQGVSSFSGHGPVVNSHKSFFRRIIVYRDDVKLS